MKRTARRINLNTDIRPVSEFRAKAAELIDHVRDSRRPLVLTQHGRSAAVVLAVGDYEELVERAELLLDIRDAEEEIESGKGISNRVAKAELRKRLRS